MQRNLVLMAVMALAGWILMPFAGIVIYTDSLLILYK